MITARWMSRDPIGEAAGSNLYSYVLNNPISLTDPLGLKWWRPGDGDYILDFDHAVQSYMGLSDADMHALDEVNAQNTYCNSPMRGFALSVSLPIFPPAANDINGTTLTVTPSFNVAWTMDSGFSFTGGLGIKGNNIPGLSNTQITPFSAGVSYNQDNGWRSGMGGQIGVDQARIGIGVPFVPSNGSANVNLGLSFGKVFTAGVLVDPNRVSKLWNGNTYQ